MKPIEHRSDAALDKGDVYQMILCAGANAKERAFKSLEDAVARLCRLSKLTVAVHHGTTAGPFDYSADKKMKDAVNWLRFELEDASDHLDAEFEAAQKFF